MKNVRDFTDRKRDDNQRKEVFVSLTTTFQGIKTVVPIEFKEKNG